MARILVVGAGIVGLSVARAALRRGHAVTLIEQGDVPNPRAASYDQHRMIRTLMDDSRRFALHQTRRRLVVTNCDGQLFKFGPLIGEHIMSAWDGETSFAELTRWGAGFAA